MYRKCDTIIAALSCSKVCLLSAWKIHKKVNDVFYILYKTDNGTVTYSPLYIHTFRFLSNRHLSGAQKFLYENPDPDKLATVSDKLKWYRYQNGLLQSDVAKAMEIDRTTYSRYEENVLDAYPLDKLEKASELFKTNVTSLLDEYNLFLYNGQGEQIKRLRKSLNLTQSEFAGRLNVSLKTVQRWEQDKVRIQKGTFERLKELV